MTVLPDHQIEWIVEKYGAIEPYDPAHLQPSSYDVCLGNTFKVMSPVSNYDQWHQPLNPSDQEALDEAYVDLYREDGKSIVIWPNTFMLGVTKERVHVPHDLVCRLEGRSSFGRLGIATHITAGYIDPGYHGNITVEMVNFAPRPIILWPGMRIAQLCFMKMTTPARTPYKGRYQGDTEVAHSRYGQGAQP